MLCLLKLLNLKQVDDNGFLVFIYTHVDVRVIIKLMKIILVFKKKKISKYVRKYRNKKNVVILDF